MTRHNQRPKRTTMASIVAMIVWWRGPVVAFQSPGDVSSVRRKTHPSLALDVKVNQSPRASRSQGQILNCKTLTTLYSTTPSSKPSSTDEIDGLLTPPLFARFATLHETLSELRKQIPSLLSVLLVESEASKVYSTDTRLVVGSDDSIELASGLTELLSLSNAFVMFLAASSRAGAFFSSFGQLSKPQQDPTVDCRIVILLDTANAIATGNEPIRLKVVWQANVLQQPASTIKGVSILSLHPKTCRVYMHRLVSVSLNDSVLDPANVGQSLAVLRQTVKGLQDSPLLKPLVSTASNVPLESSVMTIFSQVRDDFMKQQLQSLPTNGRPLAPLFVSCTQHGANPADIDTSTNKTDKEPSCVPIEKFVHDSDVPLPGSTAWLDYAACHRLATYFVETVIPLLSSGDFDVKTTMFRPDVRIVTLDGGELLQGSKRVTSFFKSLAMVRRRTKGVWVLLRASVLEWKATVSDDNQARPGYFIKVTINYETSLNIPGMTPTTVRGTDHYLLSTPQILDFNVESLIIDEIQQTELSVRENSNPNDGVIFMRSLASAIETTGLLPSTDGFWLDLLQRTTSDIRQSNDNKQNIQRDQPTRAQLPSRTDKVALTVYRIMEALYRDWSYLEVITTKKDPDVTQRVFLAPAGQYMTENVQLNGLLGETLIRGRSQYNRIFTLASATIQSTLLSGRVTNEKAPTVQIELTPKGNVACYVTFYLKLSPPNLVGIPGLVRKSMSTDLIPLKIFIASEYSLCPFTGLILQHRLVESRVNGQLTAGDVLSRWIQRLAGSASNSSGSIDATDETSMDWIRSLMDAMEWVRSMNPNAQK